ncbi:MAG: hypothetical protein HY819_09520 [Acidobacteria bacterium]|nr:hypothetical protein [Acidobacteriota bacterium]
MIKDTQQFSADLIEASLRLHKFKLLHKWKLGDQFCVTEDCELFWQMLFADCVYLVDTELINLLEQSNKKGLSLKEESEKMVFIPHLEDIILFCASSVFSLELVLEHNKGQVSYRTRLSISSEDRIIYEETSSGLRVATIRALSNALQSFFPSFLPTNTASIPIYM